MEQHKVHLQVLAALVVEDLIMLVQAVVTHLLLVLLKEILVEMLYRLQVILVVVAVELVL